jgi:hypothetical protein
MRIRFDLASELSNIMNSFYYKYLAKKNEEQHTQSEKRPLQI